MFKNNLILILLSVAMIAILFSYFAKKNKWFGEKATEVTVAAVKLATITEKVSASGKVYPEVEIKLSPDVSGEIIGLYVAEGDSVKEGQLLVEIRPDNYQSMVERAQAAVNASQSALAQSQSQAAQSKARLLQTEAAYWRNKKLYEDKIISLADFEQIKMQYEVAQKEVEAMQQNVKSAQFNVSSASASLKDALENLRKTKIYAPTSGVISKLSVKKGERVVGTVQMTGTELLRIADLTNMEVRVEVNENDVVRVSLGDTAEVEVDAYAQQKIKFKGIVTAIANTAKETVGADAITEFEVKIRILRSSYLNLLKEKQKTPFRPGMTASVDIITEKKQGALTVPLIAVTTRKPKKYNKKEEGNSEKETQEESNASNASDQEIVFVLDSAANSVLKRNVKTGISDFDNIEIVEGLKLGEKIVSGPYSAVARTLEDKAIVKVISEKKDK
jgi:HlyD family secretion protein